MPALHCLPLNLTSETNFLLHCYCGFLIQLKLILLQPLSSISSPDANLDSWLFYLLTKRELKERCAWISRSLSYCCKMFTSLASTKFLEHDHIGVLLWRVRTSNLSLLLTSIVKGWHSRQSPKMAAINVFLPYMHMSLPLWEGRVHFSSLLNLGGSFVTCFDQQNVEEVMCWVLALLSPRLMRIGSVTFFPLGKKLPCEKSVYPQTTTLWASLKELWGEASWETFEWNLLGVSSSTPDESGWMSDPPNQCQMEQKNCPANPTWSPNP